MTSPRFTAMAPWQTAAGHHRTRAGRRRERTVSDLSADTRPGQDFAHSMW
jgi:hypothetical protein